MIPVSHLRHLVLAAAAMLFAAPCQAESFLGRKLDLFDGRTDKSQPAPLVVAMHGFLGTSRNMRRKTRFNTLAERHGFVVAYPNGKRRKWNDGRSPTNPVDDVGYLSSLIRTLISNGMAKEGAIYLAGHSNGGGMAMRMACDRPDLVSGIAVVATKSPLNYTCAKGRPVPAIFFHGTKDPIAPHQGRPADSRLGGTLSSAQTIDLWVRRNRCAKAARTQTVDRRDDGTLAKLSHYTGCAARVSLVLIEGHGHDWPRRDGKATRLQGAASQEIEASVLAWQFFTTGR